MTWDQIIPEPVDSLTAFLLLAGTVLSATLLTAIVLYANRRYWLATGTYLLGLVTIFNGLVTYAYTPDQIMAQWQHGTWNDYVAAEHLAAVNYVVMFMFIILTVVLMAILFRINHEGLALMWLGVGVVEDLVNTLYGHYATAATALAGASSMPRPMTGWAATFWLSLAGVCFLAAATLRRWHGVPMAALRKVAARRVGMSSSRIADQTDFKVTTSQLLVRHPHYRAVGGGSWPEPYDIPRFRDQQRRWRRSMWRERGKYLYAVFMYGMQFYGPPMPPEYRYYELHEFL